MVLSLNAFAFIAMREFFQMIRNRKPVTSEPVSTDSDIEITCKAGSTKEAVRKNYHAMRGQDEKGSLHCSYYFCAQTWMIVYIRSREPGLGKRMIRQFVADIGPNNHISTSWVKEDETDAALKTLEYPMSADSDNILTITDHEILNRLKFARLLDGGGISVDRVEVGYRNDYDYGLRLGEVRMYGTTKEIIP
jgi:hypothetical protein